MENYPAVCLIVSSQDANLHPENRLLHMAMYTATLKSTVLCYAINNTPATASCNLKLKFKVMVHSSQLTIGTGSLPRMCMLTPVTSGQFYFSEFVCLSVKITQTGNIDSFGASSTRQSQQLQHMCMVFIVYPQQIQYYIVAVKWQFTGYHCVMIHVVSPKVAIDYSNSGRLTFLKEKALSP